MKYIFKRIFTTIRRDNSAWSGKLMVKKAVEQHENNEKSDNKRAAAWLCMLEHRILIESCKFDVHTGHKALLCPWERH